MAGINYTYNQEDHYTIILSASHHPFAGTICVIFAFPFIFSSCIECQSSHKSAQLVYYAAFVVIFQFGWAAVQISHLSLIADLTPKDQERIQLTAIRYMYNNIIIKSSE